MLRLLKSITILGILFLVCFTWTGESSAQNFIPFRLQAQLPRSYAALDGDTLLLGTSVYVRDGENWAFQAELLSDDASNFILQSNAIQGDTAVLATLGPSNLVYIFTRTGSTWTQVQTLAAPDTTPVVFGYQVALDNNTLLVGSYQFVEVPEDNTGYSMGLVDVFVRNGTTWSYQTRLTPAEDVRRNAQYGTALAIKGDLAIIGAAGLNVFATEYPYNQDGGVMIFRRQNNSWTQEVTLTAAVPYEYFGQSVDFDGTTLLVGAPRQFQDDPSSAYFFTFNGSNWIQQAKIIDSTITFFGWNVAISGDTALIGDNGYGGPTHVFTRSGGTWVDRQILTRPDGSPVNPFSPITLDGDTAVLPENQTYVFVRDASAPDELLVNGGFESYNNQNFEPTGWKRKNTVDDITKCNQLNQPPVSFVGECAYQLQGGSGAERKLVQNVDLSLHSLQAGDRIKLTGFYHKQSAGNVLVWIYVSYNNQPESQAKIKLTRNTTEYGLMPPVAITLTGTPTRVRVVIDNRTTTGKTWLDYLSLKVIGGNNTLDALPLSQVIPLPESASSLTGK